MNLTSFKRRLVKAYAKHRVKYTLQTEMVPCPLCGGTHFKTLLTHDRYNLPITTSECADCTLTFTNPMPTKAFLDHFYTSHLYRALDWGVINPTPKVIAEFNAAKRSQKHMNLINNVQKLGLIVPPKTLLDVGSSEGSFVKEFKREFPDTALSVVEPGYRFSALTSGNVAVYGDVSLIPADNKFDLITLWHVFEHVRDPLIFLSHVHEHLEDRGTLMIEVPDLHRHKSIRSYHIDDIFHYSEETLTKLAKKAGFEKVYSTRAEDELMDNEHGMALVFKRLYNPSI